MFPRFPSALGAPGAALSPITVPVVEEMSIASPADGEGTPAGDNPMVFPETTLPVPAPMRAIPASVNSQITLPVDWSPPIVLIPEPSWIWIPMSKSRIPRPMIVVGLDPVPRMSPVDSAPRPVPTSWTRPVGYPGWLVPPIVTGSVIIGSGVRSVMFLGPISGVPMLKVIVCVPAWAFASMSACRSEPAPESLMFVTSKPEPPPPAVTTMHCENSDVLPLKLTVVVMNVPGEALSTPELLKPKPPVFTAVRVCEPRNVSPSP